MCICWKGKLLTLRGKWLSIQFHMQMKPAAFLITGAMMALLIICCTPNPQPLVPGGGIGPDTLGISQLSQCFRPILDSLLTRKSYPDSFATDTFLVGKGI